MPIFEYRCRDCDALSEVLVRSDTQPKCASCGGEQLDKLMSAHSVPRPSGHVHTGPTCCGRERSGSTPPCGAPGGCCG